MNRPLSLRVGAQRSAAADPGDAGPRGAPRWSLALWSIVAFWSVYFLIATARAAIGQMPAQEEMLIRRAAVTVIAIALTWLLYLLLRRYERLPTWQLLTLSFAASVPLALAYAAVNYIAFYSFPIADHLVMEALAGKRPMTPLAIIFSTALEWYFFIAAWAVMGVALISSARAREAERRAAAFAQAAAQAELRALRYQINPHFLFNTLNSLSSLVMRDRREEAERMILNLSTFFRASLASDATEDIALAEEIALQRLYLAIEAVRFPDRLKVDVAVPEELETALVPTLILQPLVENAIKYGVSRSTRPVTVRIEALAIANRLELAVIDDGPAGLAGWFEGEGCGVGIANVRARLAARYGSEAQLIAGPATGGGWVARIAMPLLLGGPDFLHR